MNGNLNGIHIPHDADDAMCWAVGREFDMRDVAWAEAWRRDQGVIGAMRRLTEVLRGPQLYVCPPTDPPGCRCDSLCDFPCWQRVGIGPPCDTCGCDQPATEEAGQQTKETETSVSPSWHSAS